MRGFLGLTRRNVMIYFKDKSAVVFSLLTSIIVFVLYLIFIKGSYVDAINGKLDGLESLVASSDVDALVGLILLVGILGSATITVPYCCLKTLIRDKENKIDYDISATPIKRWQIVVSYYTAAVLSAAIVTGVIYAIGVGSIIGMYSVETSVTDIVAGYGIILLGNLSSSAIFLILSMLFKSSATCDAFYGILSATSGFIIGAYMPLSTFSDAIQTICNLFPATHITILLRRRMMQATLDKINTGIGGIDNGAFVQGFRNTFSFESTLFGHNMSETAMLLYVLGIFAVSILAMILTYSKTYKRK